MVGDLLLMLEHPTTMNIPQLLHETADYLLLNKPAGWLSERHPKEANSAEAWAADYLFQQKMTRIGADPSRQHAPKAPFLGVVHRLDRVTSGLLVFAKKKSSLRYLNQQWQARNIAKTYLAVVEQAPPQTTALLQHHLLKQPKERRAKIVSSTQPKAQKASLQYRHLGQDPNGHWLEIELHTGRFHQIRAQLAHMGCPIVGDAHYGAQQPYRPQSIGLHAWRLAWPPAEGQPLVVHEAPLPATPLWAGLKAHLKDRC